MDSSALRSVNLGLVAAVLSCSSAVLAQETPAATEPAAAPMPAPADAPPAAEAPPAAPAAAKPKPPPYSLPWQLRPAVVANVVRLDTTFAFFDDPAIKKGDTTGSTIASMLLASYKVTENFAPMVRLGIVKSSPPDDKNTGGMAPLPIDGKVGFLNPVIGGTYALKPAKPLRLAFFLGVTLPIGSGGGDDAKPSNIFANAPYGVRARSSMDNAMFSVNDFAVFPGVDFAYVANGFTAQVEGTLFQLTRVKGDKDPPGAALPKNPDKSKTNLTMGLHVGYFLIPQLSLGAEIRHQRFLSTPKSVELDDDPKNTPALAPQGTRDQTSFAVGPRGHFKLSESVWFRPGVAFVMGLDDPMKSNKYKIVWDPLESTCRHASLSIL